MSAAGRIAFALAFGCVACDFVQVDHAARCESLNARITDCFGGEFATVECDGVSDTDLENLDELLDNELCAYYGDQIPVDGDPRSTYCRLYGEGCVPAFNPQPDRRPARYPVVLVNGIDVSPAFRYSDRIQDVMRDRGGHDVHLAVLTPYDTTPRRSRVLWERIQEITAETGAERVNLICHSLGGLDCRYLVSPGGLHWDVEAAHAQIVSSVASVTTVSTAHRGTRAADAALGYLPTSEAGEAVDRLATFLGEWFTEEAIEEDTRLRGSIAALSETAALAFNADIVDAQGVYYQSWGGFARPFGQSHEVHDELVARHCQTEEGDGLSTFQSGHDYLATPLLPSYELVGQINPDDPEEVIPNDGLCNVISAKWGRFRGCIPIDHMEQLGQRNIPDVNVRSGFDVAFFYTNIAGELARMGF